METSDDVKARLESAIAACDRAFQAVALARSQAAIASSKVAVLAYEYKALVARERAFQALEAGAPAGVVERLGALADAALAEWERKRIEVGE